MRNQSLGESFYSLMVHLETIQLWSQLPADALVTPSYKSRNFRKRVRKVINKAK
jgi:hypothetical protein